MAFYASAAGRAVLADMRREVGRVVKAEPALVMNSFMDGIKAKAGVDDEMAIILAESKVARSRIGSTPPRTEPKKQEENLLEIK